MTHGLESGARSMGRAIDLKLSTMYIFLAQRRRQGKGLLRWWRLAWIHIHLLHGLFSNRITKDSMDDNFLAHGCTHQVKSEVSGCSGVID